MLPAYAGCRFLHAIHFISEIKINQKKQLTEIITRTMGTEWIRPYINSHIITE